MDDLSSSSLVSYSNKCNLADTHSSATLWHSRLGHPSYSCMKHMDSIPKCIEHNNNVCTVCPLAKQHRSPFPMSSIVSSSIFELLYVDIWGPIMFKHVTVSYTHLMLPTKRIV